MIWTSELLEIYQKLGELPFKRDKKLSYLLGDTKENFVSPYYRGNNMLKAPNLNFELTEDELKNTLVYKSDKVRFGICVEACRKCYELCQSIEDSVEEMEEEMEEKELEREELEDEDDDEELED